MKQHHKLQKSWIWDKSFNALIKKHIKGYSLNVCAGNSPLGDKKIDLDPQDKSIIKGDMRNLPFNDETFDTVISDPPWKINFYNRWKIFFECVRVCKTGGIIIYNAYWIPHSNITTLDKTFIRQDHPFSNTSIVSIFTKRKGQLNLKQFER